MEGPGGRGRKREREENLQIRRKPQTGGRKEGGKED